MTLVPHQRIQFGNEESVRPDGAFVLYWMISARRIHYNFGLQRGVELSLQYRKPLVVLEALRCDYRWASVRLHRFVVEGMADNQREFSQANVVYYPYIEPLPGAGRGLIQHLANRAVVIVTDDYPCFFLARMVDQVCRRVPIAVERVDSNGILPMRSTDRVFSLAYSFRRHLQQQLPQHLEEFPVAHPLVGIQFPVGGPIFDEELIQRWPPTELSTYRSDEDWKRLPIDQAVAYSPLRGGHSQAGSHLQSFIDRDLSRYLERNHPDDDSSSGLSPYLHFGHISAHEILRKITDFEGWTINRISDRATGSLEGWWGTSAGAEGFLDELITWRELGFNFCSHRTDYDQYESLPEWAQNTLEAHALDRREYNYDLDQFQQSRTHDPLWNAAQNQLVLEGRMHNYLRMLWGKKILEWSPSPQDALGTMLELNNRYALDGRDPNSYSGIFWVLGRYDRAWGPERPIFGKIRYMSSENTARKLRLKNYLLRYAKKLETKGAKS